MTDEQRQLGLANAAKTLWIAALSGVGIEEAMEELHVLYGCPRAAKPQGVFHENSRERRLRRKV